VAMGLGIVILGLSLAPWPGLGKGYVRLVCATVNAMFGTTRFASDISLHFDPGSPSALGTRPNAWWHAIIAVRNESSQAATRSALNLRAIGYLPSAVFVSFALAWPFGNLKRALLLRTIAFVLVQAFVALSIALPVVLLLSSDRVGAIELGPTVRVLINTVFQSVVVPPAMSYAVPALIWLLVTWAGQGALPVSKFHSSGPGRAFK
jgi:hypothetical protein